MKALPFRAASMSNPSLHTKKSLPAPDFSGNFDLFFTSSTLIPNSLSTAISNAVDTGNAHRNLYKILAANSLSSSDARGFFPDQSDRESRCGTLWSSFVRDPLNDEPLEIGLYDLREVDGSSSSLQRKTSDVDMDQPIPRPVRLSPGLVAGALVHGLGDIVDSFGEFIIHRVWCDFSEEGTLMEVFRGHFVLQVFFGDIYVERGFADVAEHRLDFWGVRSKRTPD